MSKSFNPPDGFEIKTGDQFSCGLIDIDYTARTVILTGIGGHSQEQLNPQEVWAALKNGPPEGIERSAVVVFQEDGNLFQLEHYDLKQFERACYGPL